MIAEGRKRLTSVYQSRHVYCKIKQKSPCTNTPDIKKMNSTVMQFRKV